MLPNHLLSDSYSFTHMFMPSAEGRVGQYKGQEAHVALPLLPFQALVFLSVREGGGLDQCFLN